jgi:peptidoglycan-associated lipoprotein
MVRARSAILFAMMAFAACGGGNKPAKKPVAKKTTKKKAAKKPAPPPTVEASPNLAVDEDLVAKCKIPINNKIAAPKFDHDRFDLLAEDRDVLDTVASCIKDGPLSGKHVILVGHTDASGTIEYNLALGTKRATVVGDYLERQGVSSKQIGVTTRGETDAEGGDNESRKVDRRVDITLEKDDVPKGDDSLPKEDTKS